MSKHWEHSVGLVIGVKNPEQLGRALIKRATLTLTSTFKKGICPAPEKPWASGLRKGVIWEWEGKGGTE